jgi:putative flippase GtrA
MISNSYNKFRKYFSSNYPRTYDFCNRHKSIIKFTIAGSLAGGVDLIFLFLLHGVLKMNVLFATSLAFIASFAVSFSLQKFWTFRNYHKDKIVNQLVVYFLNALLSLGLNVFFMHILINNYGVWYLLAQIIVNVTIGIWNFVIYKTIIFKPKKDEIFS